MVFQKQKNKTGSYVDKQGVRFDVLSCERTESKKWREAGRKNIEIEPGVFAEQPIFESFVAVNDGWDAYESLEAAVQAYGLTYEPLLSQELL